MSTKRQGQRRRGFGSHEQEILDQLSLGDMLYAHLLSGRSTNRYHKLARERATERYRRKLAIERLELMEYIQRVGEDLSLTDRGRGTLGEATNKTRQLLETQGWDYKWRIATFDIPEKYAPLRNKVRTILKRAGFVRLQNSVWIFPHDCKELVQLIQKESHLSRYILYGVLEHIEDEPRLKKLFGLK